MEFETEYFLLITNKNKDFFVSLATVKQQTGRTLLSSLFYKLNINNDLDGKI